MQREAGGRWNFGVGMYGDTLKKIPRKKSKAQDAIRTDVGGVVAS
jgi:hypothetical protein